MDAFFFDAGIDFIDVAEVYPVPPDPPHAGASEEICGKWLANRPRDLHVVVTGRNAKPELIEAADLVTEMTLVKHPFREQGVKAQKGIEF